MAKTAPVAPRPVTRQAPRTRSPGEQDVAFLLVRAFYDLREMLDRLIDENGLSEWIRPGMGPVLYALYERDDCPIKDIVERTGLSASTLTRTLERLVASKIVDLQKDRQDRRAMRVRLTEFGRSLEPQMRALRRQVRQVLHGHLDEKSLNQTKQSLVWMILAMDVHRWKAMDPRR